jgi:5,5'-dehydrodivanillate O-demethylase
VPVDDENTLSVTWAFRRVPKEREPYVQARVPYWYGPLKDARGEWIVSHVMNQDFVAWVGQGPITDRTQENLGRSDIGIARVRKRLLADVEAVAAGEDPKGLIRDPALNQCVRLPMVGRNELISGYTMEQLLGNASLNRVHTRYHLQFGQPEAVAREYEEAMGFEFSREGFVDKGRDA